MRDREGYSGTFAVTHRLDNDRTARTTRARDSLTSNRWNNNLSAFRARLAQMESLSNNIIETNRSHRAEPLECHFDHESKTKR